MSASMNARLALRGTNRCHWG